MIETASTETPGEAALAYAALGWSVIPVHEAEGSECSCGAAHCRSPGKHPRVRWEDAMERPAPPARIEAWWHRWPTANVGVVTGSVSRLAVLDVDPRNGGDAGIRSLESRFGPLPVTPETCTGGGGTHLWFRIDEGVASGPVAGGVELKANGGMVVAPPSLHASGRRYTWRPGGSPDALALAPLPDWLSRTLAEEAQELDDPSATRTEAEQEAFADAWSSVGVLLEPGDRSYLCPFHDDHHPSLHIDAEGCRWFCFGCGEGGGIGRLLAVTGEERDARPRSRLRRRLDPGVTVTLDGDHEIEVVGESRHQDELLDVTGGHRRYGGVDVECVAELVPDPENPADPDAVRVHVDGGHVGYIGRGEAGWVRSLIDERAVGRPVTCRARIKGGWDRGRGDVGMFGVTLFLPDPPTPTAP